MPASFEAGRILGERMRKERQRIGITQMDVANLANINVAHYGRIERGDGNPNLETLVRVASVFGVDPADLIRGLTPRQLPPSRTTYSAAEFVREKERRSRS